MKELKQSNPIELVEYATNHNLLEEPAFVWWAKKILKRRDHIVSKVKSKYWKTNQKFGINLPHTVPQALKLDQENGNNPWFKAIKKEMKHVRVAFRK